MPQVIPLASWSGRSMLLVCGPLMVRACWPSMAIHSVAAAHDTAIRFPPPRTFARPKVEPAKVNVVPPDPTARQVVVFGAQDKAVTGTFPNVFGPVQAPTGVVLLEEGGVASPAVHR